MTRSDDDRWVRLDGTTNTRDLGGLPTADGDVTARGRVLRSDDLQSLSAADVVRLVEGLGVSDVVDLRTTAEIRLEGRGPLRDVDGIVHRHFTLLPERGQRTDAFAAEEDGLGEELPADWAESLLPRQLPAEHDDEPGAVRAYLGYLREGRENVLGALRALAHGGPGAVVVHCAAGKDRTSVVVALALSVTGVEREAIIADYAQTAEVIDDLVAKLARSRTYAADATGRDVASHTPRAATMRRVLALLDEQHGGPLGWLDAAGFSSVDQAALRCRLLGISAG